MPGSGEVRVEGLIDRIGKLWRRQRIAMAGARARKAAVRTAIEQVVDEIDPRIRAVSGYHRKLRPAVERTLAFSSELVAMVPGPIEVDRQAWSSDPLVKAFFSGVEELQRVFGKSEALHDFFSRTSARQDHCYALLSMICSEQTRLGTELDGEILKREVRQKSVSFEDHRVVKPAASISELRWDLESRVLEVLVSYVLKRITELKLSNQDLREQRHLVEMQIRLAQAERAGLAPLLVGEAHSQVDVVALRERLQQTEQQLEQSHAKLMDLDDYIDRINEVLGRPDQHVQVRRISMRLNNMNIKLDENSKQSGNRLELTEISLGDEIRRVLTMVKFPRAQLLPRDSFLTQAERILF